MKFFEKLLSRLNGLHYRQEYLCVGLEDFSMPLNVYVTSNNRVVKRLGYSFNFVGYSPVIFALPGGNGENAEMHIVFSSGSFSENEVFTKKDVLAELHFSKIDPGFTESGNIVFYKATAGRHHFVSAFHQFIIGLNNALFSKKAGNVFLKGNLLKQVQVAYSLPRKICLITVGKNNLFNLFPTDLHGQASETIYVISLRHEGKACQQVLEVKQLVLSEMDAKVYQKVYALGKNHMQPLKERNAFEFSHADSASFHLPLPQHAVAYKELVLAGSFVEGIHRLLIFQIKNEVKIEPGVSRLAHIHTVYATWRESHGLPGNYLLR